MKLIITIGLLFTTLMSVMSFFIIHEGKRILNTRLEETCTMVMRHVSNAIKDELLLYYNPETDDNSKSLHLGIIRESILSIYKENIEGLNFVEVIDRNGRVIAHTSMERMYEKIDQGDSTNFINLTTTLVREQDAMIEYIHPMYVNAGDRRIFVGAAILGFSKSIILRPVRQVTQAIVMLTVLVILFSIVFIFYIARRMTVQIDALGRGLRRVRNGDLNISIPMHSTDELGRLTREFNAMIVHLREKLQMQKFVSSLTMQMIHKRSDATEWPPVGEKREITVLFSDVRSFSQLTEKLGAEEVVKLINIYLDLQAQIVEEHDGIVDKFMGDQIMAIFLGEDQADRAIQASVSIQRAIGELNHKSSKKGQVVLEVGCGLHIGEAILGHMGSQNRLDYTVIGDVVNLAARFCALAKPGQIIVPLEMVRQLNGKQSTVRLQRVKVKGRSQPVEIFEVDYDRDIIT
ncbi:HAMP domain-containing protein [candidate division KSB1 bacterium]|nr:HAMP domain-containing protein [candidate division KSB1 bacterium]